MEQLSRTEKKRRAKGIEKLAIELVKLSAAGIKALPCDDFLKGEIKDAKSLKAGARKRQIKYITKQLRELDAEPFFNLLAEKNGSKLKKNKEIHQLEHWRDNIVSAAIEYYEAPSVDRPIINEDWQSPVLNEVISNFNNIDTRAIKIAAAQFVKTRKPAFSREIFRIMKAAFEKEKFQS